jgi:hypothetical protein
MKKERKFSRSLLALALVGAMALTACDDDDNGDDDGVDDPTVTTVFEETTTTLAP